MLIFLLGASLAHAQFPLPGGGVARAPVQEASPLAAERAKAETLLVETQRRREADGPVSHELASAESVRAADRQRLLDRLAFLQAERIKRLDELAARQKAPPTGLAELPVVQGLGEAPPYSARAVDALRDELDGLSEKLKGIDSGLLARETEKQVLVEQLRRAEEGGRLAKDRLAMAGSEVEKSAARWASEEAGFWRQVAEAELAIVAIDVDKFKLQRGTLNQQVEEMRSLLRRVLPDQRLTEADLAALRERLAAVGEQLATEVAAVLLRQKAHEAERAGLAKISPTAGSKDARRLAFLEQALTTDAALLEGLRGLEMLVTVTSDVWEKRYLILTTDNAERKRLALASINKIYQGLLARKRLLQEQRSSLAIGIREQETRLANQPPETAGHEREKEILEQLRERAGISERLELAAQRLERQLARWQADFSQGDSDAGFGREAKRVGERVQALLQAFWQYELFAVEDVSEVDGRKVSISYGVTVGKSIGALLLFVLGYWLFSRLSQLLQAVMIRRFGIDNQLASVIRRWVMIILAIGLIVFILNLARIPLTVFAFMGGALAIGIGFGTQTIIKNFISGIIILFERKIRVGDIVELAGMTGHVTAVDLRATTVRGFNGVEALVPNSNFLENQVVNWTYSNPQIRRELSIGVAYGSDTRQVETIIAKVAVDHPDVLKTPPPEVYFEDFADSALLMVLIYWVELGGGTVARRVDSDVRHAIYQRLSEAGIAIPFPQRDVNLNVAQPLPVVLTDAIV